MLAHLGSAFLALLALAGCGDHPTRVRVTVDYRAEWALTSFAVDIGDRHVTVDPAAELLVLLPDGEAGGALHIAIDGLRAGELWAQGAVDVAVDLGGEARATVVLALAPCDDPCVLDATMCAGDGVAICEHPDGDRCPRWTTPVPCPDALPFCSLGACAADCTDECAAADTLCSGTGAVRACGQAEGDSDDCLDWLPAVPCADGETCSAGRCAAECVDACATGAVTCSGGGVSACTDVNGDGCLDWAPPVLCTDGETCSGGRCSETCTDDCTAPVCSGDSYQSCGNYDLDPCLDLGVGTSCAAADACQIGSCSAAGCVLTPATCTTPPAPTCANNTTRRTYAGTGTCSAGSCNYAATDTVCAGGGACVGGACACAETTCGPVVFASGQDSPRGIAQDATHVYWASYDGGTIRRRAKNLGAITTVASMEFFPLEIAVDEDNVYWTGILDGIHVRSKSLGSPAETLITDTGAHGIAIDDTRVYWTDTNDEAVRRNWKEGPLAVSETVATDVLDAAMLAVDDNHVYWTVPGDDAVMRRSTSLSSAATVVATGQLGAEGIAVDGTHVYWTNYGDNRVMRRALSLASSAEVVASAQDGPVGIAVDGQYVYWTSFDGGAVRRRAKSLGAAAVETLAADQDGPRRIVVDAAHVYWTNQSGNDVMSLSRCACGL